METKKPIIKTAIIEKRREWRERFITLINFIPGFLCTGNYVTLGDALRDFTAKLPDVVLCNFHFADAGEKKFVGTLRQKYPALPILVFNFYDDGECIFDTSPGKNDGCLFKITLPAKLLQINSDGVLRGNPIFESLTASLIDVSEKLKPVEKSFDCALTPHEKRLLELLVEGHNHTSAARVLNVSYNTVKFHMRRIYQKLDVNSKSAAVAKALRCGLII